VRLSKLWNFFETCYPGSCCILVFYVRVISMYHYSNGVSAIGRWKERFGRWNKQISSFLSSISIDFLKIYSFYSAFCLHFTQFSLNSFEKWSKCACLIICLLNNFEIKIHSGLCSTQLCYFPFSTHTLGKIYFLLYFACFVFLWSEGGGGF